MDHYSKSHCRGSSLNFSTSMIFCGPIISLYAFFLVPASLAYKRKGSSLNKLETISDQYYKGDAVSELTSDSEVAKVLINFSEQLNMRIPKDQRISQSSETLEKTKESIVNSHPIDITVQDPLPFNTDALIENVGTDYDVKNLGSSDHIIAVPSVHRLVEFLDHSVPIVERIILGIDKPIYIHKLFFGNSSKIDVRSDSFLNVVSNVCADLNSQAVALDLDKQEKIQKIIKFLGKLRLLGSLSNFKDGINFLLHICLYYVNDPHKLVLLTKPQIDLIAGCKGNFGRIFNDRDIPILCNWFKYYCGYELFPGVIFPHEEFFTGISTDSFIAPEGSDDSLHRIC